MRELPSISEAEYQVMKIIWGSAPISTNDVVDRLEKQSDWKPKTIQTLLGRLVKKGVLSYHKESRVFVYTPLVHEDEYLERESENFLDRFYGGRLQSMVVNFLEQDKLSPDEINQLQQILEQKKPKGG